MQKRNSPAGADILSSAMELVGFALVVVGVSMWSTPVALIVAGLGLMLFGFAVAGGEQR